MNSLKFLKKQLGIVLTIMICFLTATTVQAGPIVTEWSYDTWAEFTASTFSSGGGTTSESLYELSWGSGSGDYTNPNQSSGSSRSALTLGDGPSGDDRFGGGNVTGMVDTIMGGGAPTGDEVGTGISATHWNNTLSGTFATLTGGTLTDYLTLDAATPDTGGVASAPTIAIDFKFQETVNNPGGGFCLDGSSSGDYTGGCPDIFGFQADLTVGLPFVYDGNIYEIDVLVFDENGGAAPIAELDSGYCGALGFAGPCAGLVTNEEAHTTFQFGFDIRYLRTVPEPSSLILLAIAILFLGTRKQGINIRK